MKFIMHVWHSVIRKKGEESGACAHYYKSWTLWLILNCNVKITLDLRATVTGITAGPARALGGLGGRLRPLINKY